MSLSERGRKIVGAAVVGTGLLGVLALMSPHAHQQNYLIKVEMTTPTGPAHGEGVVGETTRQIGSGHRAEHYADFHGDAITISPEHGGPNVYMLILRQLENGFSIRGANTNPTDIDVSPYGYAPFVIFKHDVDPASISLVYDEITNSYPIGNYHIDSIRVYPTDRPVSRTILDHLPWLSPEMGNMLDHKRILYVKPFPGNIVYSNFRR